MQSWYILWFAVFYKNDDYFNIVLLNEIWCSCLCTYNKLVLVKIWYFVWKLFWPTVRKKVVLVIKENFWKFEANGREFESILRPLKQFIQTVKGQKNFSKQNSFLTCYWRFLHPYTMKQLKCQSEHIIGM